MLNILAAGELHYWNVLRQHIQDDDGGGEETHMRSDCTAAVAHLNVPRWRRLVSVREPTPSLSN